MTDILMVILSVNPLEIRGKCNDSLDILRWRQHPYKQHWGSVIYIASNL